MKPKAIITKLLCARLVDVFKLALLDARRRNSTDRMRVGHAAEQRKHHVWMVLGIATTVDKR